MSVDRIHFTGEQIKAAEKREGYSSHPVLGVIETHLSLITKLNEQYRLLTATPEQEDFCSQNFGFLADALVKAGPFTLQPLELVAIWSRLREIFTGNRQERYFVAAILGNAYAIQGMENPDSP